MRHALAPVGAPRAFEARGGASSRVWLALAVAAIAVLGALGVQRAAQHPALATPLAQSSSALPGSLRAALSHDGVSLPVVGAGATALARHGNGVVATLGADTTLAVGAGGRVSAAGAAVLQPVGIGRAQLVATRSGTVQVQRGGTREQIGASTTVWYRSTSAGLEQGFTVAARPAGTGALRIAMRTSGTAPHLTSPTSVALAPATAGAPALTYSGLAVTDAHGRAVPAHLAVTGSTLQIVVSDGHAAYPLTIDPTLAQQVELSDSAGAAFDRFGNSVALSQDGDTALIGSPNRTSSTGAVFVYVRSAGTWTQQTMLTSSDAAANDNFGFSVSISADGNTALVGARGKGSNAGAAYIFTRTGTTWTQQQRLTPSSSASGDYYGIATSLSSDGGTALISAYGRTSFTGTAFVFTRTGTTWAQQAQLSASVGATYDSFAGALALAGDGNTAVIGAFGKSSAYIFTRASGIWTQRTQLAESDFDGPDGFGTQVAISRDGTTVLVGATGNNAATGAAYLYQGAGATWTEQQKITASDAATAQYFGSAVALSDNGNVALIDRSAGQGAVYRFVKGPSVWAQDQKLMAADGVSGDYFGVSLGLAVSGDGSTTLVGAKGMSSGAGAAYVFARSTATTLSASSGTSQVAASVTYTATVSPVPSGGTIGFADGGVVLTGCGAQPVNVSTGVATCTISYSAIGPHTVIASYTPADGYTSSVSTGLAHTVIQATTLRSTGSYPYPSRVGQAMTYALTVTPTPNGGTTAFVENGVAIPGCEAVVVTAGFASCSVTYWSTGTHIVYASYSGTADYQGGIGSPIIQNVIAASTGTTLASSSTPAIVGAPVTYSASLAPVPDGGTVAFRDGEMSIPGCTAVPVNLTTGLATCQMTYQDLASHTIVATYSGNGNYVGSSSSGLTQTVAQAPTTSTLSSSANPIVAGSELTYSVTVAPVPNGGTVAFSEGELGILGCEAVPVDPTTGIAVCKVTYTAAGTHTVHATYSGTAGYVGSASADLGQGVSATPPVVAPPVVPLAAPIVTSRPDSTTSRSTATFAFAIASGGSARCTLDGGAQTACSSPETFGGLAVGRHTFVVWQTNAAGQLSPTTAISWQVARSATRRASGPSLDTPALTVAANGNGVLAGCALRRGTITRCTVTLYATVGGTQRIVGAATRRGTGDGHVAVTIKLTPAGRLLAGHLGGLRVLLRATITSDAQVLHAATTTRVVLPTLLITSGDLLFDTNSAVVKPAALRTIAKLRLTIRGASALRCVGFTDDRGNDADNLTLGVARARAVCAILAKGSDAHTTSSSPGAAEPRASNASARGRASNRRVEVHVSYT